jgi:inhibitor of KinA
MNDNWKFRLVGDQALMVELGERISPDVHLRVRRFCDGLKRLGIPGVTEWVPAYTTVTVYFDPWKLNPVELMDQLSELGKSMEHPEGEPVRTVVIPVLYGGPWGPDLPEVARLNGLNEQEVIQIHAEPLYFVCMMGFVPGFAYLSGMSDRIATPRLATPRGQVPAGSVGIAGEQTGIYPLTTPGGWRIIGRTPIPLFRPENDPPTLLRAGDRIRFRPVAEREYQEIERACVRGEYQPETEWTKGEGPWVGGSI